MGIRSTMPFVLLVVIVIGCTSKPNQQAVNNEAVNDDATNPPPKSSIDQETNTRLPIKFPGEDELGTEKIGPIRTGFLFIGGKYIEPPYTYERRGVVNLINGVILESFPGRVKYRKVWPNLDPEQARRLINQEAEKYKTPGIHSAISVTKPIVQS